MSSSHPIVKISFEPGCGNNRRAAPVNKRRHGGATWGPVLWNQSEFQFGSFFFVSKWGNHLWGGGRKNGGHWWGEIWETSCLWKARLRTGSYQWNALFSVADVPSPSASTLQPSASESVLGATEVGRMTVLPACLFCQFFCAAPSAPTPPLRSQTWIIASPESVSYFSLTAWLHSWSSSTFKVSLCRLKCSKTELV